MSSISFSLVAQRAQTATVAGSLRRRSIYGNKHTVLRIKLEVPTEPLVGITAAEYNSLPERGLTGHGKTKETRPGCGAAGKRITTAGYHLIHEGTVFSQSGGFHPM